MDSALCGHGISLNTFTIMSFFRRDDPRITITTDRAADMVRYDTAGKEVRYWLKHRGETRALLRSLEKVVHASGKLG